MQILPTLTSTDRPSLLMLCYDDKDIKGGETAIGAMLRIDEDLKLLAQSHKYKIVRKKVSDAHGFVYRVVLLRDDASSDWNIESLCD